MCTFKITSNHQSSTCRHRQFILLKKSSSAIISFRTWEERFPSGRGKLSTERQEIWLITKGGSHQTRFTGRKQVPSPLYSLSPHDVLHFNQNVGKQCYGLSRGNEEDIMKGITDRWQIRGLQSTEKEALSGTETPGTGENVTLTVTQPVFPLCTLNKL